MEVFKQIIDYPDYFISNRGRVISTKYRISKFMKPSRDKDDYPRVSIRNTTKKRCVCNHILVATLFVPNPNPELFTKVNHKDGNKQNTHYTNLEWCTHKMNVQHAVDNRLIRSGEKHAHALLTNEQVIAIRQEVLLTSTSEVAKRLGYTYNYIRAIHKREHYKYV